MDFLFPRDDRERLQFKESALQIGFEELTAECTASINLLQPHDRLSVLMMAWKKIGDYLTHNQYTPSVGNVVYWVGRHTLELWFGRDWISCPAENKTTLIEYMMKVYPTAYIAMCPYSWPYMFSIYRDPWMVDYLNINFQRMNDPELSDYLDTKDSDFILQEGLSLIFLRIVNMFDFNMMKLVKHMCRRLLLAWHDRSSSAHRSLRAAINATECIEYVRHMYLITFYETSGMKDLHYVLECVQRNMHCNATEYSHLDRAAQIIAEGLLECKQTLMEFLIAFLSKIPERQFSNTFGNSVDKYKSFLTEYLLRKIHNRKAVGSVGLLPTDGIYENLIKMFIKKRESSDDLMKNTPAVSERLFAGVHDLKALKFSYDKIKSLTRVEWYTTKITILLGIISEELNVLEDCKYTEGQTADELIKKEQDLAIYYRDLSRLLGRTPVLEQEAWLTTFSLYPCREYLDAVTKCGSRNLRAIKKQAIKLKVISEPKLSKPSDNGVEHNTSSIKEAHSQNVAEELSVDPTREEFPCTSISEGNCSIKKAVSPTGRKTVTGKAKRPLPTKAIKPINKPRPKSKLIKKPSVELVARPTATTPIPKKPLSDCKDKNTAEVIFAASAGAGDNVSFRTEETIKYPGFALINSVTDTEEVIKYTDYDGEVLAQYRELTRILSNIRLQHSNYDDLLALLIAPRYKRLTWATCWKNLRKRCRFLLTKDNRKKQLVEQYLADANERLTHLQIDYEKYKNKPQIDYGSIEDGYECFETESGEERGLRAVLSGLKRGGKIKRINIKSSSQDELDEPDRSEDELSETESFQSTTERIDEEQLIQKFEILVDADQKRITSSDSPQDGTAHGLESERILQEAPTIQAAKAVTHIKSNLSVQGLQRLHGSACIKKNPSVLVHRLQVSSIGQLTPRIQTASIPSVPAAQKDKELPSIKVISSVQSPAQLTPSTPTEPTIHRDPIPAASPQEFSSDQGSPSAEKAATVHLQPSHVQSIPTAQVVSTPATPPSEADAALITEAETLRVLIPKVPLRTYSRHRTVPSEKLVKPTTGLEGSGSKLNEESPSITEVASIESSKPSEESILSTATADTNAPTKKVSSVAANVDKFGEKRPLSDPLSLEVNLDSGSTESLTLKETTYISDAEEEKNSTEMARDWRCPHPHPPMYEEDPELLDYGYENSANHSRANHMIEPEYESPHLIGSRFAQDLSYAAQQLSAQTAELLNQAQHMNSLYFRPQTNIGNRGMMRSPQVQSIYVPNLLPHHTYGPYPRPQYRDQYQDSNVSSCPVVYSDPNPGAMSSTYIDYPRTNPVPVIRTQIGGPVPCLTICQIPIKSCSHGEQSSQQSCAHSSQQTSQQSSQHTSQRSSRENRVSDRSDSQQEQEEESSQGESEESAQEESAQEEPANQELQESTTSERSGAHDERVDNEYISFSGTEDAGIFLNPNINRSRDRNTRQSTDLLTTHIIPISDTRHIYADAQGTIPRPAYQIQTGSSGQTLSHLPSVDSSLRNFNIRNRNTQTEAGVAFAQSLNQARGQTSHSMANAHLNLSGLPVVPIGPTNQARSQIPHLAANAQLNASRHTLAQSNQARLQIPHLNMDGLAVVPIDISNQVRSETSHLTSNAQLNVSRLAGLLQSQLNQARSQTSHLTDNAPLNMSRLAGLLQNQLNQTRSQASHLAANAQLNEPRFGGVSHAQQNQAQPHASHSMATTQLNVSRFASGQLHQARLQTSHLTANAQLNVPRFAGASHAQLNQVRTQTSLSMANAQFNVSRFAPGQLHQARSQTSHFTANAQLNDPRLGVPHAQLDQAQTQTFHSTTNYVISTQSYSNAIPTSMALTDPLRTRESSVDPRESVNMSECVDPSSLQTVELTDSDSETDADVAQDYPITHISHASTDVQVTILTATYDIHAPTCSRDVPVGLPGPSRYVPSEDEHVRSTNFYRATQSEPGLAFATSQSDLQPSHSRANANDEFDDDISAQSCSSGLRSSSALRHVRQTGPYTYIPPELNTVQIVKPSGTTRINRMTVELGQGMRTIIPNDRRDVLKITSANRFPNPRWRPFFSSMLKRKLIFVPSEAEAEEILNEYSSQRRNGKWTTQIVTFGLKEDTPEEEITDETVIINLTNPKFDEETDVDTEEWSTQRTGHINHSRPEIEGAEAGVRYNLDPPIHFFLGIPSPAYSLSIVCPFGVQGANAPSEILTVDPEFSYKIYMFLREDDFAWELLSLSPTQAPSNHESDDDDDDNQLDFQQVPQADGVDVEVVNINNGVRTQAAENMDVNQADNNGGNDGDDGDEGEPPEGGEGEAREADNDPNDDQGEDDEEESDPRTDGEQESEGDDEEDGDGSEDDELDDDRENVNEENIPQAAASSIQPEVLPQRCHNLSDSDSDSTERSDIFMRNANQHDQFLHESRMRFNQQPQMQEFEHTLQGQELQQGTAAPDFENQNSGISANCPGTSGRNAEPYMQRIPGTSMAAMEDQNPYGYRSATKRILEDSDTDSDSEILVRRSGRYALKVYGAGSRTRVMEGRPGPSTSRTRVMEGRPGPSTSGRQPMSTNNPVPEPDIICLSSSSTSDDNTCDHARKVYGTERARHKFY